MGVRRHDRERHVAGLVLDPVLGRRARVPLEAQHLSVEVVRLLHVRHRDARLELLGLRASDVMTRDGEIPLRVGARLFVLLDREHDVREAARVAALTEKRERPVEPEVELARLRGDALVRAAEDVLCSHP